MAGTKTTHDARSTINSSTHGSTERLLRSEKVDWRPYNSRNHGGEGQHVLFVDGHVSYETRPTVGLAQDNIYTIQLGLDRRGRMAGMVPGADQRWGPRTSSDSFLVP